MPKGSKSSYSAKQKRQAEHIEEGYKKRGVGAREAGERAWRTVNKQTGGAKGKKSSRARSSSKRKTSRTRSRATAKTSSRTRGRARSRARS